ncbi:MAG: EamA family transporter [Patescibacteria group bacterium]
MPWYIAALLSAVFAALTAILAKIGIKDVNSNLATAIRTTVILVFTWGIVFFQGTASSILKIGKNSMIFLILSGVATGLSWLFYFYALKVGQASKVVSIDKLSLIITIIFAGLLLKEKISVQIMLGAFLITVGTIMISFAK